MNDDNPQHATILAGTIILGFFIASLFALARIAGL